MARRRDGTGLTRLCTSTPLTASPCKGKEREQGPSEGTFRPSPQLKRGSGERAGEVCSLLWRQEGQHARRCRSRRRSASRLPPASRRSGAARPAASIRHHAVCVVDRLRRTPRRWGPRACPLTRRCHAGDQNSTVSREAGHAARRPHPRPGTPPGHPILSCQPVSRITTLPAGLAVLRLPGGDVVRRGSPGLGGLLARRPAGDDQFSAGSSPRCARPR